MPFLVQITLPDGSLYKMMNDSSVPSYYTVCSRSDPNDVDAAPGTLSRIKLPTGGGIDWQLQAVQYSSEDSEDRCPPYGCYQTISLEWAGVREGARQRRRHDPRRLHMEIPHLL